MIPPLIVRRALELGLHLIAEGVETDIQARYLKANGCLTMQGYLFHRPIALPNFITVLQAQDAAQSTPSAIQA